MERQMTDEKVLADGTWVKYCHPHRRWEWDCANRFPGGMHCGGVNSTRALYCENCGGSRVEVAERKVEVEG